MEEISILNLENADETEIAAFNLRTAARLVLVDKDGRIPLLFVGTGLYHKLPGGGVEPGETPEEAAAREALEETGYEIEIMERLGTVVELRKEQRLRQVSIALLARIVGGSGMPHFTPSEVTSGCSISWFESVENALHTMSEEVPTSILGEYVNRRDVSILQMAQRFL